MTLTTIYLFFGLLYLGLILEGLRRRFKQRNVPGDASNLIPMCKNHHKQFPNSTYHKPDKSLLSKTKLGWEDWQPDQYPKEKIQ